MCKHSSASHEWIIFPTIQRQHLSPFPYAQLSQTAGDKFDRLLLLKTLSHQKKWQQKTLFHNFFLLFPSHLVLSHLKKEEALRKRRKQNLDTTFPATEGRQIHICQMTTNHILNNVWVTVQIWSNSCSTLPSGASLGASFYQISKVKKIITTSAVLPFTISFPP